MSATSTPEMQGLESARAHVASLKQKKSPWSVILDRELVLAGEVPKRGTEIVKFTDTNAKYWNPTAFRFMVSNTFTHSTINKKKSHASPSSTQHFLSSSAGAIFY
jgi:hypothetical protein